MKKTYEKNFTEAERLSSFLSTAKAEAEAAKAALAAAELNLIAMLADEESVDYESLKKARMAVEATKVALAAAEAEASRLANKLVEAEARICPDCGGDLEESWSEGGSPYHPVPPRLLNRSCPRCGWKMKGGER